MSQQAETLDDIEQELGAEAKAEAEAESEHGEAEREASAAPHVDVGPLIAKVVMVTGNLVCKRANVSPLQEAEGEAVGEAVADVLSHYDMPINGPAASWATLGIVLTMVVLPRMEELEKTIDAEPTRESEAHGQEG